DLRGCGRADRLAPARPCHPDARRRARLPLAPRSAQPVSEPVVLRLSGVRRNPRLPALSPAAPPAYAAGGRPGPRSVGAVPHYARELSAQVLARYQRTDRLRAAQGAIPQRARRAVMDGGATFTPFRGKAWAAARRQCDLIRGARARRRVVGLSAAVAAAAADPADGDPPPPQTPPTWGDIGKRRSPAQHAHHQSELYRARAHCPLFCQLPPGAPSALFRALLQSAQAARDPDERTTFGPHGSAAELPERAAARDRQAGFGRPSRRDRQHGAAQARRPEGQRGSRIRGILMAPVIPAERSESRDP